MNVRNCRLIFAITLLILTVSTSCTAYRLAPAGNDTYNNTDSPVTEDADGITFRIFPSRWDMSPYYLEQYVTPVYVEIENRSDQPVEINYSDFALLTGDDSQINPIPPPDVAAIVFSDYYRRSVSFSHISYIGFGFHRFHHFQPYRHHFPYYHHHFYPDPYFTYSPDVNNVLTNAFLSGTLRPGARISGYVYFNMIEKDMQNIELEILYRLNAEDDKKVVSFPLKVVEKSVWR